jgi:hypothetical protein
LSAQQKAAKGSSVEALWQQAMIKMGMRDIDAAITDISNVIRLTKGSVLEFYMRGLAYTQNKQYPLAYNDLMAASKLNRTEFLATNAGRYINAAEFAMFNGLRRLAANNDSATLDFNEVLRLTRCNGWAYFYRAMAHLQAQRQQFALADIENASALGIADAKPVLERLRAERAKKAVAMDDDFPTSFQLYPRDAQDSATVRLAGRISSTPVFKKYDSVVVETLKNGVRTARMSLPLLFSTTVATTLLAAKGSKIASARFSVQTRIHAELSEYNFRVALTNKTGHDTTIAYADSVVCGDVVAVCGEANALRGKAPVNYLGEEYARTYSYGAASTLWKLSSLTNNHIEERVGGLGGELQRKLIETYHIPVCILNASTDVEKREFCTIDNFLPPVNNVPNALYNWLLFRARQAGLESAVRAIVWYHGISNTTAGYTEMFRHLYEAWCKDFPRLQQVYVLQMPTSICAQSDQNVFREMQRRFPEVSRGLKRTQIQIVPALAASLSDKCHHSQEGFEQLATRLASQIGRDFYGNKENASTVIPTLSKAVFTNSTRTEIALVFSPETCELTITPDVQANDTTYTLGAGFVISTPEKRWRVVAVRARGNVVTLTLNEPCMVSLASISYPATTYPHPTETLLYEGPWLLSKSGMPVLSWFAAPVQQP